MSAIVYNKNGHRQSVLLAVYYEEALVPRSPEAGEFFATHKEAEFERRIERRPTLETIDRPPSF